MFLGLAVLIACAGLVAACASGSPEGGTPTTSGGTTSPAGAAGTGAAGTSAPAFAPPSTAEAERAFEHVRVLAGDIGSRAAGTPSERRAAEYIRDELEASGYTVTIEPFTVDIPRDNSMVLGVPEAPGDMVSAIAMTGAPDGEASGRVVQVGLARAEDFAGLDLRGAVAFADRGVASFREKAVNAQRAGAVALIVANNQPGQFRGTIADGPEQVTIPVVGVSSDGAALIDEALGQGARITVRVTRTSEPYQSQNVLGRPSAEPCTAYVGGHYDSVPQAPGANDNASGTALVLELARTHRVPGLCYLAFGAEEVGLVGSAAFVRDNKVTGGRFMLNLDMMGKVRGPQLIPGADEESRALAARASSIAGAAGVPIPLGSYGPFASSDHVSFARAGVPAVTFYSGDDEFIHTARDNVENVSLEDLRTMLRAASAVLRELLAAER